MDPSVFLVAAAIAAVVFGALGAWISSEKGRSGTEGLLLGLLFGPLGCLIEALLPAETTTTTTRPSPKATRPPSSGGYVYEVDLMDDDDPAEDARIADYLADLPAKPKPDQDQGIDLGPRLLPGRPHRL